jgi:class 3 adenylate cyclase
MNEPPPAPKANTRRATVMFADISGFTALGERLDPEEVIGIVNGAFQRLEEIVYAQGGAIDEYLGDCVKAAFGLTLTAGNGASHAVHAAMAMRDAVARYNVDRGLEPRWASTSVSTPGWSRPYPPARPATTRPA